MRLVLATYRTAKGGPRTLPVLIPDEDYHGTRVAAILQMRFADRVLAMLADWQDEAAITAVAGHPKRAFVIEHFIERMQRRR